MDIDTLRNYILPIISALTPIIFAASAYFAYNALQAARRNILETIQINRRNKRADTILHCNVRYDELYKLRISIRDMTGDARDTAIHAYYARFWGLKSDQFDYWLAGLIDIHTFFDWASSTLRSFKDNKPLVDSAREKDFMWGWHSIGWTDNEITNPWFSQLIFTLIKLSKSDGVNVAINDQLLELLNIVDVKSRAYRDELQREMSIAFYVKTRRDLPNLGLLDGGVTPLRKTSRSRDQGPGDRSA